MGVAAQAIKSGDAEIILAGGVESMSRAPFVMGKAETAFFRNAQIYDTTIGWRFINPEMERMYGTDSMPETGENVAEKYQILRADQDAFAYRSQQKCKVAMERGQLAKEIVPVEIKGRKGTVTVVDTDEHYFDSLADSRQR